VDHLAAFLGVKYQILGVAFHGYLRLEPR
jgi:hypothetical protein